MEPFLSLFHDDLPVVLKEMGTEAGTEGPLLQEFGMVMYSQKNEWVYHTFCGVLMENKLSDEYV